MKKKKIYYDYKYVLSYNADISIIYGGRGIGKSFGAKILAIKDFFNNGSEFIYLKRYVTEIDKVKDNFMKDINKALKILFPDKKGSFLTIGEKLFYKEEDKAPIVMGYFLGLNIEESYKSNSFPNVKTVIFDECLTSKAYLKKEFFHFCSFLDTIYRSRKFRVIMLSNAVSVDNPYFEAFGITGKEKGNPNTGVFSITLNKKKDEDGNIHAFRVAVDNCEMQAPDFKKATETTSMALLAEVTEYGNYSRNNEFSMDDSRNVIGLPSGKYEPRYNLILEGKKIGVYHYNGCYYFGEYFEGLKDFCTSAEDAAKYGAYAVNSTWLQLKTLKNFFNGDRFLYKDIGIKNSIILLMRKLIRKY